MSYESANSALGDGAKIIPGTNIDSGFMWGKFSNNHNNTTV